MGFFNVKVSGTKEVFNELDTEKRKIEKRIPQALEYVGGEMIKDLQGHIHNDWYLAYRPKYYLRRTDDPSLGTPLGSEDNMYVSVKGNSLDFTYFPTGEHQNIDWAKRNGDPLIEFLQNGQYNKESEPAENIVPPRPFWNNFVERQFNERIMLAFTAGMLPYYNVITTGKKDIAKTDTLESMLDAGTIV